MATIRKRGSKWQTQIRRDGFPPLSKSFASKEDAVRWGRGQDRRADAGELGNTPEVSLGTLLVRYERDITCRKRSADRERFHLRQIARHWIANLELSKLTSAAISAFRDDRLKSVSGATVCKELGLLSNLLKIASNEWGFVGLGSRSEYVRFLRTIASQYGRVRERRPRMAMRVDEYRIVLTRQRRDHAQIGHETSAEDDSIPTPIQRRDFCFQHAMKLVSSGSHARCGRAHAVAAGGLLRRMNAFRTKIHPEIAVGAKQENRLSSDDGLDRTEYVLDLQIERVGPAARQPIERIGEGANARQDRVTRRRGAASAKCSVFSE